jgi:DNA-binding NarL/FixJ family response regulator
VAGGSGAEVPGGAGGRAGGGPARPLRPDLGTRARVVIADDHAIVRRGLRMLLDAETDLRVVAEAEDGAEAVEEVVRTKADLAILDVSMPRMTGLQAAREIGRRSPETRTLILSMYDNEQFLFEALKSGASGYVLKSGADRDVVDAARAALRGQSFLYAGAVTALVRDFLERGGDRDSFDPLTLRESEVLKLIAEAHSSREIAEMLFISLKTVERHRANILEKLGMRDRVELTRYAIRRGLIEP